MQRDDLGAWHGAFLPFVQCSSRKVASLPAHLIVLWREGRFDLLTAAEQVDEPMRVTRYPKIRERLAPALAGRLVNELRDIAIVLNKLPEVTVCADPYDNYLLALARYEGVRIISVRTVLIMNRRLP